MTEPGPASNILRSVDSSADVIDPLSEIKLPE